ncbi:MAG: hypothetical protein JWN48_554 [Myxococcaceae bacterium]|nr:hypothetical protein [Myxococcaceae bacterium]
MKLAISRPKLGGAIVDIELALRICNESRTPITIYPAGAQLEVAGWGGPLWQLRLQRGAEQSSPKELRLWYGPPGMPPIKSYYERFAMVLQPQTCLEHRLTACWLPHQHLPPNATAPETLDPAHMDGVTDAHGSAASVLVLQTSSDKLRQRMRERPDFLRPSMLFFVPQPGTYALRVQYAQRPSMGFEPERALQVEGQAELIVE